MIDAEAAVQALYDAMTKLSAQSDKDYEFVHEMADKLADGEEFTESDLYRIASVYARKFGG